MASSWEVVVIFETRYWSFLPIGQCFTILWQQPGIQALQVLNPDKQWVNAPPIPGSLVIKYFSCSWRIILAAHWLISPASATSLHDGQVRLTLLFHWRSIIEYAKDDIFKATMHRAVNRSGVRRYSIPLFFGTDYNVKLEVWLSSHSLATHLLPWTHAAHTELYLRRSPAAVRSNHSWRVCQRSPSSYL